MEIRFVCVTATNLGKSLVGTLHVSYYGQQVQEIAMGPPELFMDSTGVATPGRGRCWKTSDQKTSGSAQIVLVTSSGNKHLTYRVTS